MHINIYIKQSLNSFLVVNPIYQISILVEANYMFIFKKHVKAELLWQQRGAWEPGVPASPGAPGLSLKIRSQVEFKCCLNAHYLFGHIVSVFVSFCFSGKLSLDSFILSVTDPNQILLCKSFEISGLRKMPGPTEADVGLSFISSQSVNHTSTC